MTSVGFLKEFNWVNIFFFGVYGLSSDGVYGLSSERVYGLSSERVFC